MMSSHQPQAHRIPILVMLLSATVFGLIAWQVFVMGNLNFDRTIALYAQKLQSETFTSVMVWMTFLGSTNFLFPAYVVLVCFLLATGSRIEAMMSAVTGIGTYLLIATLKMFFGRTRPVDSIIHAPGTFSFPSGHSGSGMTFLLLLAFLITRRLLHRGPKLVVAFLLFFAALLVGCSRIYLRVHYPTDVLSGFCVAFFWLASMYLLYLQLSRSSYFSNAKEIVNHRNV